ncbi:MAG: A/G-specific adenine glycosylase [Candidatus Kerfeldbacteria bacterium]|nr:A/G-specific adenine glycosylase [Candidatus Kerfeldbacteria bacterium]
MLQQTQVDRVVPKYLAWKQRWPTTADLASARLPDVLRIWSGLGYNSRALRLREAARQVMERFNGRWPTDISVLESLPGFGPYTARAVASFAHGTDHGVIDTNVRRVVGRLMYGVRPPRPDQLKKTVETLVPARRGSEWNAALMDFGSAVCTSRAPKCATCPMQSICRAYPAILVELAATPSRPAQPFTSTDRFWRGEILRQVLHRPRLTRRGLLNRLRHRGFVSTKRFQTLLDGMSRDCLIQVVGETVRVAK